MLKAVEIFRDLVVRPVLEELDLWSESAELLLLGTAAQESNFKYLKQLGAGPAIGIYQMEPRTHDDIRQNWLSYNVVLKDRVRKWSRDPQPPASEMVWNLRYATAMACVHYRRVPAPLPPPTAEALGAYWKRYYNTPAGAGTVEEFVSNFELYVA